MRTTRILLILTLFSELSIKSNAQIVLDSIPDGSGYTYIASPTGSGPFPAVLYNHGGLDTLVGGDLRGTVIALAQSGYLARAEKRMETPSIIGHLEEVEQALDSLRSDPRTDTNCVSIMGFSRGGYLALKVAKISPQKVNAIIAMAPADPAGLLHTLVTDVSTFNDSVLILVANNDTLQGQHVEWAQMIHDSLINGGKQSSLIIYPDYDANENNIIDAGDDGHLLFFEVRTSYWQDVLNFLSNNSCSTIGISQSVEQLKIKVYPNPTYSYIMLEIDNYTDPYTINIYNLIGQKIYTAKLKDRKNRIQLPNIPELYILEIRSNNKVQLRKNYKAIKKHASYSPYILLTYLSFF